MKIPFIERGLFGWNYRYLLSHPWKIVEESYYHAKWFVQRGYRGYSDSDAWDLGYYLAGWMPSALLRLEKNKLGHPCGMTRKGWDTRLRIMREGFEAAAAIGDTPDIKECRRLERRMNKGLEMFQRHYLSLWD